MDSGDVAGLTSIALDASGNVHISYTDGTNGDIKYASNASGSWKSETVDSGDVVGWTSIALDTSGNVHISYTNSDLKYASKASGSWKSETVDSEGYLGWPSVALDTSGNVHISYHDFTKGDLKYATNHPDYPKTPINGDVSLSSDSITATFKSTTNLNYATTYTAIITTEAKDLAGNFMESKYTWSFTTASRPGPDLIVTTLETTGPATMNSENNIEIPIRVVIKNQGDSAADIFKVSLRYTGSSGEFSVGFTVKGQENSYYPFTKASLVADAEVIFEGIVTFISSFDAGDTISMVAIADSCFGDEFTPDYCRVDESNEDNNTSAAIELSLNSISNIRLNPPSPASLAAGQQNVNIDFDYIIGEKDGVRIFATPFSDGSLSSNYAASGSPIYQPGKGSGGGFFTIRGPLSVNVDSVNVDQIRFQMFNADRDQSKILLEFFIPVDYTFFNNIID